jgi:outer membrane protein OmpU
MTRFHRSTALAAVLAATAGVAAAEITLSGDARMGISNDFVFGAGNDDTVFNSRARVTFTMTGSTDGGLEFGASFRADNAGGASSGTAGSVYVSGAFGKLSMGDVDGAAAAAVGQVDGVGYTGLGDLNEIIYPGNGGSGSLLLFGSFLPEPINGDESVLYEYSAGDFAFYAGVTQQGFAMPGFNYPTDTYSLGAAYTTGNYRFGIGYERVDIDLLTGVITHLDQVSLGADATFGAITLKARFAKGSAENSGGYLQDNEQWALSATYTMDALALTAFASNKQMKIGGNGLNKLDIDAIGLGVSYDLGGGAAVKGGIVKQEQTVYALPTVDDTAFDLGLTFSF